MSGDGVKTSFMDRVRRRLREPSTMAGIAVLATAGGVNPAIITGVTGIAKEYAENGSLSIAAIAGVLAILMREKGGQ